MVPEQTKDVMTNKEYVLWLEMSLASAIKTIEKMNSDLYHIARKNMELEEENLATTMALIRNPLRSTKQFNA